MVFVGGGFMRQKRVRSLREAFLGLVQRMKIADKQQTSFWRKLKRGYNESKQPKMKDHRPEIKAKIERSKRRKKKNAELATS